MLWPSIRPFSIGPSAIQKGLLLLGLILLAFPHKVFAQEELYTVTRIELCTKYASPPPETFLPLIPLKEGDQTTHQRVQAIEQSLQETRLFRSVSTQIVEEPGGLSILFDLRQIERVRRIRIKGNWLVLSSSIYRALTMQEGEAFDEKVLPGEVELIKALYKNKGWHETAVTSSYEQDPEDGSVQITYRIKRGHHIRFDPIELEGVKSGEPEQIQRILRIWPWVTTKRLNKRIDRVEEYYGKLGYPKARARIQALEVTEKRGKALLRIRVDEGKRLVTEVIGNKVLSAREILGATTFLPNKGYGLFDAEDSVEAIEHLYQKKGFPNAQVTFKRKETDTEVKVAFTIREGKKTFIKAILVEGNESIPEKTLSKYIFTRPRNRLLMRRGAFVEDKWEKDRRAIVNHYMAGGFLEALVEHSLEPVPGRENRSLLRVRISEGPRYTVASTAAEGVSPALEKGLRQAMLLEPGEPFHEGRLAAESGRIAKFYGQRGHLLARIDADYRILEDHTVDLTFKIQEGPCYRLSGLLVSGNRKTHPNPIRNAFRITEGEPITQDELGETRRRLYRLGTFEGLSIRVPGLEASAETQGEGEPEEVRRPVLIEVRERRSLAAEVGVSFDTDWGFEGLFSLREENLFGRAKKVTADFIGGERRSEARVSFADPTLMAQRATGTGQVKYERREWASHTEQRINFEGGFFRKFRSRHTPGLFLLLDWANVYDVVSDAPDAPEPTSTFNFFVRPQLVRDARRDKLYPTDGSYGEVRFAVSNEGWGSDDNLFISQLKLQDYWELVPRLSLASRLWLDDVTPYGRTEEVPSTYLLFCGGNNTVRGFARDELGPRDLNGVPRGGTTRIIGNMEIRFPIYRLIHGVAFVDVGSLTDGFDEIEFETFRWSIGGGARLHTPVGPVRLEYGYQLQDNPPTNRGQIHFALGFPF
jgi:outer membrane protein insertion porin family